MDISNLKERLESAIDTHKVAGAAAAVFADGEFATASAGLTNLFSGVEMSDDTVMHIGSITKVFNATLVMQLVDEGLGRWWLVMCGRPACQVGGEGLWGLWGEGGWGFVVGGRSFVGKGTLPGKHK